MSHYLFLSGTSPDFTVELNQPLNLEGEWEVGLVEMVGFPSMSSLYYILSDLCEYRILNSHLLPVLRCIFAEHSFLKEVYLPTLYLPVSKTRIERVRIYIKDINFQISSNLNNTLNCTLHLRGKMD